MHMPSLWLLSFVLRRTIKLNAEQTFEPRTRIAKGQQSRGPLKLKYVEAECADVHNDVFRKSDFLCPNFSVPACRLPKTNGQSQ